MTMLLLTTFSNFGVDFEVDCLVGIAVLVGIPFGSFFMLLSLLALRGICDISVGIYIDTIFLAYLWWQMNQWTGPFTSPLHAVTGVSKHRRGLSLVGLSCAVGIAGALEYFGPHVTGAAWVVLITLLNIYHAEAVLKDYESFTEEANDITYDRRVPIVKQALGDDHLRERLSQFLSSFLHLGIAVGCIAQMVLPVLLVLRTSTACALLGMGYYVAQCWTTRVSNCIDNASIWIDHAMTMTFTLILGVSFAALVNYASEHSNLMLSLQ